MKNIIFGQQLRTNDLHLTHGLADRKLGTFNGGDKMKKFFDIGRMFLASQKRITHFIFELSMFEKIHTIKPGSELHQKL